MKNKMWTLQLKIFVIIIGLSLNSDDVDSVEIEPMITIDQGKIRGKISESRTGRNYVEFLGIPYAGKPKRFQVSDPAPKWDGVRDGTKFGHKCIQYNRRRKTIVGSEDCLYLNVYTPVYSDPKQTRLPVMVYIHGGSFMSGSGSDQSPEYFMDDDVIIVTFNYRLGTFGFLTTLNKNLIANLGMKDQTRALTWVKDNIRSFGGDDERITIFGTSAGGASVSYHMLSPLSYGLFHAAISQSGNALCPWALVRNPTEVAIKLGGLLNCSTANSYTIAACLKVMNASDIVEKQQLLTGWNPQASSFVPFGPVIETIDQIIETGPVFLPDSPKKLLKEGKFYKVPWLTGVNSADGITSSAAVVLNNTKMLRHVDSSWAKIAPLAFSYKDTAPNPAAVSQKIRDFYFGHGRIGEKTKENFTNALTDRNFFRCAKNCALLYAQHSPVWIYYFTHRSNSSTLDSFGFENNLGLDGVVHMDELQYLFKMDIFPEITVDSMNYDFSKSLVNLWVSFASNGAPKKLWGEAQRWDPIPKNQIKPETLIQMYNIDDNTSIIDEPFHTRLAFWDKLRLLPPQASVSGSSSGTTDNQNDRSQEGKSGATGFTKFTGAENYSSFILNLPFVNLCLTITSVTWTLTFES